MYNNNNNPEKLCGSYFVIFCKTKNINKEMNFNIRKQQHVHLWCKKNVVFYILNENSATFFVLFFFSYVTSDPKRALGFKSVPRKVPGKRAPVREQSRERQQTGRSALRTTTEIYRRFLQFFDVSGCEAQTVCF